ncbi:MAG: ferritin-like domain-containing protein [Deltaproteobacteria bacterium]|nr:ferritin-like domain-containing protein [Deltaproteobacteria bacterium]
MAPPPLRIDLLRARARYLLALGALGLPVCKPSPEASAQTPPNPHRPGSSWQVPSPDRGTRRTGCQSGVACIHPSRPPPAASAGPAPFQRCDTALAVAALGMTPEHHRATFSPEATLQERRTTPNACCYSWSETGCRGRPLRDGSGAALVAPSVRAPGDSALDTSPALSADPWVAQALAAHWSAEAAAEHASVAAFAREATVLRALGAPEELLRATQRAALDEVEHARRVYAEASRWAGAALGPGALPPLEALPEELPALVDRALLDGCLGEGCAALEAEHAAHLARDPDTRALLDAIARDETEHAALAWRTVRWALRQGGDPVRERLRAFRAALARGLAAPEPDWSGDGPLAPYGVPSPATARAVRRETARSVVLPCLDALLAAA